MNIQDLTAFDPDRGKYEMKDATFNILIGGEAGQGLITVGQILSKDSLCAAVFLLL